MNQVPASVLTDKIKHKARELGFDLIASQKPGWRSRTSVTWAGLRVAVMAR